MNRIDLFEIEHLPTYKKHVIDCKKSVSSDLISCGKLLHSEVVLSQLIMSARKEIRIYANNLMEFDTPEVIRSLLYKLDKKDKFIIDILVENRFPTSFEGHCRKFKKFSMKLVTNIMYDNFCVIDSRAYKFNSIATFNRPEKALYLIEKFNITKDNSVNFDKIKVSI